MVKTFEKYIGNKQFYKMVLLIVTPIIVQNGITNFVSLLDNLMVGLVGTEQMSGVAIANQLMFIYYLCIFGGMSGAGIFTAQYFGAGKNDGVCQTFRYKIYLMIILTALGMGIFSVFGSKLVSLYISDGSGAGDPALTLGYGLDYLNIALWGCIPFGLTQAYSSTLRECGKTVLPMKASIVAVITNLILNYLLIFGKFGFPVLGVKGAAIATLVSRFAELGVVAVAVHTQKKEYAFLRGLYSRVGIERKLAISITKKGMPLLANEFLWSFGMALLTQTYSARGLAVVAGLNISTTVTNLFNVICMSMGNAVAIIVGQVLGAGNTERARDYSRKMITFTLFIGIIIGVVMLFTAPYIPLIYNTTDTVRKLSSEFLIVSACCMPIFAFLHTCYFTLRSGGKSFITFLFDSMFVWVVSVPLALLLVHRTALDIVTVYLCCQLIDLLKCGIGYILLKKGIWIQNIVKQET